MRGKLVRDRIPDIIREAGQDPTIVIASPADFGFYVREKLREELGEYLSSGDVAELSDVIEACFAAATLHDVSQAELLAMVRDKRAERGGFDNRIVWLGNRPKDTE